MPAFIYFRQRPLFVFLAFLAIGFASAFDANSQALPEDAPVIISNPDSTKGLVVQVRKKGVAQPASIIAPGGQTRIALFITNIELLKGEGINAFRADIQDNIRRYPLKVVSLQQLPEKPWIYSIGLQLNDEIGDIGDVLLRITWRGMSSNRVRLSIGHEGGKVEDDPGSVPTPMPEKPPVRIAEANIASLPWNGDRVRFMEQASFGPKAELESRLRRIGYSSWIAEQMEIKFDPSSGAEKFSAFPYPALPLVPENPSPTTCPLGSICARDNYTMYPLQNWFFREALYGEEYQLRRRVSWALSQIWVVSGRETIHSSRVLQYIKVLDKHAFGNYRDLMREMTLNPAMGNYLDMAISTRTNPNENYAREILQLFSIGLFMLNQDGTPKLDGQGDPIPTYDQNIVNGFTKVFTGWTFCNVGCPNSQPSLRNFIDPMVVNPANHDIGAKQLLNYPGAVGLIPAGQAPDQDLEAALDNIFYHPNVAPFVSRLMIQQLITSNPTPAYISRVAAKFNDNGQGIRGDMKAVIRAILLDPEARGNLKSDPDYGHLREPVLFLTNILRPFNPASQIGCGGLSDGVLNGVTASIDQDVFNPPSVFNYYPMDYILPNTSLSAPEFSVFSTGTALKRTNIVNDFVFAGGLFSSGVQIPCGTKIDLSRLQSIAASDISGNALLDTINREMMHGSMSAPVRAHALQAIQAVVELDSLKRARTAVYLTATSPQFQVQR